MSLFRCNEAESKEKHGVWGPMPELTITLPYSMSTLKSTPPTHLPWATPYTRDDLNHMPELTLSPPVKDFAFGLWMCNNLFSYRWKVSVLLNPDPDLC
jgi:hypothetical protein